MNVEKVATLIKLEPAVTPVEVEAARSALLARGDERQERRLLILGCRYPETGEAPTYAQLARDLGISAGRTAQIVERARKELSGQIARARRLAAGGGSPGAPGEYPQELPIEGLYLSSRSYHCLRKVGIDTLGDLCDFSARELMEIRNFGSLCLLEVEQKLAAHGGKLSPPVTCPDCGATHPPARCPRRAVAAWPANWPGLEHPPGQG